MAKVSVIIPAAGSGKRFGAKENKIFQLLADRPIFLRTLERFVDRSDVVQVLLVLSETDHRRVEREHGRWLCGKKITLAPGGSMRAESVRNAIARLDDSADLICVHDAVRPCVKAEWIDTVFKAAEDRGAAMLAEPVHGTVKRVDESGCIERTVNREGLFQAQTPQVFSRELFIRAYQQDVGTVTDDAQLIEQLGEPVYVVPCDARNLKITTPADLAIAEAIYPTL